jgi:hypothetical protein
MNHRTLLLRWNNDGVEFFRDRKVDAKKLLPGFRATSGQSDR